MFNLANNGEFIARYLLRGAYTRHCQQLQGKNIDIAIIRTGINDSKRFTPEEYSRQLKSFIRLLQTDFPGIQIILETGFYLDYPKHYSKDRNRVLSPYWKVNRDVAKELGFPLSDVYAVTEKATAEGDWDIRIRSLDQEKFPRKPARFYWGKELDDEYGHDPDWFTDVHPNPHGVRMAVAAEVALLKEFYPERLPAGGGKITVTGPRPQTFFADWIQCSPERLLQTIKNPDQLQKGSAFGPIRSAP